MNHDNKYCYPISDFIHISSHLLFGKSCVYHSADSARVLLTFWIATVYKKRIRKTNHKYNLKWINDVLDELKVLMELRTELKK